MIRITTLCLFLLTSLELSAWQNNYEKVYTARAHLERAQELLEVNQLDSARIHCEQALKKAPSYREVYIVTHKVYEAMEVESSLKIENLKAGQEVSLQDEELAYYLGQVYQKEGASEEAIAAYSKAIDFSKENDGEPQFRYYYYMGRGATYLLKRTYDKALDDFSSALEIDPDSGGALINRGFCYYNTKEKEKACDDWRKASKLGRKDASNYIGKYCFE